MTLEEDLQEARWYASTVAALEDELKHMRRLVDGHEVVGPVLREHAQRKWRLHPGRKPALSNPMRTAPMEARPSSTMPTRMAGKASTPNTGMTRVRVQPLKELSAGQPYAPWRTSRGGGGAGQELRQGLAQQEAGSLVVIRPVGIVEQQQQQPQQE